MPWSCWLAGQALDEQELSEQDLAGYINQLTCSNSRKSCDSGDSCKLVDYGYSEESGVFGDACDSGGTTMVLMILVILRINAQIFFSYKNESNQSTIFETRTQVLELGLRD